MIVFMRHAEHQPPRFWPGVDVANNIEESPMAPRHLAVRAARYSVSAPPGSDLGDAVDGRIGLTTFEGRVVEVEFAEQIPDTAESDERVPNAAILEFFELPSGPTYVAVWTDAEWHGHPTGAPRVGDRVSLKTWRTTDADGHAPNPEAEWSLYKPAAWPSELLMQLQSMDGARSVEGQDER